MQHYHKEIEDMLAGARQAIWRFSLRCTVSTIVFVAIPLITCKRWNIYNIAFVCKLGPWAMIYHRLRIASRIPEVLAPLRKNFAWLIYTSWNIYILLVDYNAGVNVVVRDCSTPANIDNPEVLKLGAVDMEPKHMLVAWQRKRMLRSTSTSKRTPIPSQAQAKGVLSIVRENKQHCLNEKQT